MAIAALVLAICVGETLYGLMLDSRFLLRDGLEWGYDVVIYGTAALAFGRGLRAERYAGFALAWVLVAMLWRFRDSRHPVIEATWLSARNDAVTSTLYALAMMAARLEPVSWPQMAVDSISAILCLQAGGQILRDLLRADAPACNEEPVYAGEKEGEKA